MSETSIVVTFALIAIYYLVRVAIWLAWPRKTDHDPMSEPFGEMPNDGRRG